MKIFTRLLFFLCLLSFDRIYAQESNLITINVKNASLENVLGKIIEQTKIQIFYDKEVLKAVGNVSIQVKNAELKAVLDLCLHDTKVKYALIANNIVVLSTKKDAEGNFTVGDLPFSMATAYGNIINMNGMPLNGATVFVLRTKTGVVANALGAFTIPNIRTTDTLQISFIGYESKKISVNALTDHTVKLKETKNDLDEVMVQAYGRTTRRFTVGEIDQVSARDIGSQPVSNPLLALQGAVPGLIITPTSGFSNSPVKVEIRGRGSIDYNTPTDPLYVIDGTPFVQSNIGQLPPFLGLSPGLQQAGGSSVSGGVSPLSLLNPRDIESITILKDAAATAMYGSRAGNGVILITTKKGKPGETKVDITASHQINRAIGQYDLLNTSQYLQMRREAFRNDGLTPTVGNAPDLMLWDTTRNINWQKELFRSVSLSSIQASISGGSELTSFRLSGQYNSGQDVSPLEDENTNKFASLAFNFNHHSADQKFTLDMSNLFGHTYNHQVSSGNSTTLLAPDLPSIFDKNGNLNYADWNASDPIIAGSFPFASLLTPSVQRSDFLNSSLNLGYQILTGLKVSMIFGYNLTLNTNSNVYPIASQNPLYSPQGTLILGNSRADTWNVTPQIDYSRHILKGLLNAVLGGTYTSKVTDGLTTTGTGYTNDQLLSTIGNAPHLTSFEGYAQNKYLDIHARLNYIWEEKYILEFTGNRDGSSSFGPGRQFGNFYSAGVSWIATEEKWVKNALPAWISLLKLSGTYGTTGVSGGDYQYLSQWASNPYGNFGTPLYSYNGNAPLVAIHAVNQDYRWETDKQLNASFDLGLLNDRINMHLSFYQKRVNDQLTSIPTPAFTGFPVVEGNSAANVQNQGIEFQLGARIIDNKDFSWSVSFNISHNRSKLLSFPGIEYTPYYTSYKIGEPITNQYLLHYLGIDPRTGQRSYQDYNRDGLLNIFGSPGVGTDDRYANIDLAPKFTGGGRTNIRYKRLTLGLMANFVNEAMQVPYAATPGSFNSNVPPGYFTNHWQKPGDISSNPRFTTSPASSDYYFASSDGSYTSGSYVRLDNVSLAYLLPDLWARKLGLKNLGLMFSMQNVLTLSKYPGPDPQAPFGSLPQPMIFNGQLTVTF